MSEAIAAAYPGATGRPLVVPQYRLGDVRHVFGAADRLRAELGFVARVAFGAGMREFATSPLRAAHGGPPSCS
jgi:dTDP-L-rhamnose 4-epimerase